MSNHNDLAPRLPSLAGLFIPQLSLNVFFPRLLVLACTALLRFLLFLHSSRRYTPSRIQDSAHFKKGPPSPLVIGEVSFCPALTAFWR